ncbi:amino acid adenylation domain-containing protein [Paenibacillus hunanensis]|uniref:non-ribosomal peptide synthetase n=1 Tax=Paenibacillus hunanensis TaxID=539262 RepID=UPI0020275171|nr:non-ribosomal peptide synthetase [Paenibacillus hunanensis]MCL9662958.1 amino acid adenylation domain-containing protein [Paenibacillus hunanensis]
MNTPIQSSYSSYELSHTQKRFWFMDQLDFSDDPSARSMSHVSAVLTLTGALDIASFQQALHDLATRHAALRTCYAEDQGEPVQLVFDQRSIPLTVMDMSADHNQQELKRHIQEQLNTTFNLLQAPLMRCTLYKLSDQKHTCLIVAHHSIADGLSVDILLADLMSLYRARATGAPHRLPELAIQYSDYAHWHNGMLQNGEMQEQQQFWQQYLSGELPDLNFPIDYQRPPERTYAGAAVPLVIPATSFEQLKKACEQLDVSMYMFLLGIMNVLLAKYTRNRDIIVGTSLSGRFHPDLNRVIGSFINTLPVRNRLDGEQTFREFVLQIKRMMLDVQENQAYPFDKITQDLGVERNNSRHPIYDVVFEMHALHADSKEVREVAPDLFLSFEHSLQPIRYSAFDFAFELYQKEGMIEGYIQYASDLFKEASMERLSRNFIQLATQAAANPAILISEMDMLSAAEHAQVLEHFNSWTVPFPVDQPFPVLFEQQVQRTPHLVAASFDGEEVTYAELNARTNRLAHLLKELHIGKGDFVAVMSERHIDWLAALIGILKSGAAYVPIDTNVPDERAAYILQDCEAKLLITESHLLERAAVICDKSELSVLCLDKEIDKTAISLAQLIRAERLEQYSPENPASEMDADRLAYMIYTSGSTGVPKGALVRHNGMINHLYAKIVSLELTEKDIVAQNASISFDVSIWQSLVALLVGAQTSIISFETGRDQALLFQHMQKHAITIIETVPSLLFAFLDTVQTLETEQQQLPDLRWMIANGEELPSKLVKSWFERFSAIPLINAYGPTECSDDVTQYAMHSCIQDGYDLLQNRIPIGRPLPNMRLYVVDQFHKLVPVGVKGEIWIAGIGVGAGYWHNEELTSSKFITNPFARHEHERIAYRTGDLGFWLPDGNLEFSSRIDYQVKVRGFRIELGEVETVVNHHPDVDEAAVITRQQTNGDFMLIAFYTSQKQLSSEQLRLYVQKKLPYYMVPAQLVAIDRMPLLASEKIDRKQLQARASDYIEAERSSKVKPSTATERELAILWADVLEQDNIFADDHFFHLGGHSISAVKLVNRIREKYGISMPLQQIFAAPVLQELAVAIDDIRSTRQDQSSEHGNDTNIMIQPTPAKEAYAVAPVQLPEWYLHELEPDSSFYNVSFDLMFYGQMDVAAFVQAWQQIIDRHSVLRTYFDKQNDTPIQRIHPQWSLQIDDVYEDRRDTNMQQLEADIRETALSHSNQIFDFANGPLFSIKLAEYPEQQFLLMFAAHHIIWDETSSMNVINELSELYNAQIEQRPSTLQPLSIQYSDYAEWMNGLIEKGALEHNRRYWLERFKQAPPALNLPTDYARPSVMTFNGDTILTQIDSDLQQMIADYCQQQGITLYMFLLSVLHLQLHRLSGQDYFAVGSPIANRNAMQLEPMLGLFASAIPLSCAIEPGMTFTHLMEQGKRTAIEAYDNHLYPGNLVIEQIQTENDLSRPKLFSVMYGLQNNKQNLMKNLSFTGLNYNTRVYDFLETSSRFDLTFAFDELGDVIELNLNYNTDLFKRTTALRIAEQFMLLARQVVTAPNRLLHEYAYVDQHSQAVISAVQHSYTPQSLSDHVSSLIEQQAERSPELAAIHHDSGVITYRELNEQANRLAHRLLTAGVQPEQKIGVSLTRSADLIIAMLAIWKAGAAYVAIPVDMPEERRNDIVQTAGLNAIIADASVQAWCESLQLTLIQPSGNQEPSEEMMTNPGLHYDASKLAYVLFTSGTTGRPKGIEIEHGGIVELFAALQQRYGLQQEDRALFHTSYAFDASLLEMFWPLTCGASIYIPQPEVIGNPVELGKVAAQQQITFLQFVPLMLEEFVRAGEDGAFVQWPELRFIISGGAALHRKQRDRFQQQFTCELHNHYGPTEVTVDATVFDCSEAFEGDIVPIGTALPHVRLYILDTMLQPVPIGVPGELYIESSALARGYMNDPQRTASTFIKHPFDEQSGARLYKTGDIVKWLEDGVVSYIGRMDQQVKVRGNRVELEEIEALLAQHTDLSSAAVVHRYDENYDDLVAYVEIAKHAQPLEEQHGLAWFNLAQMPQLIEGMNTLHRQSWPEYFIGDAIMLEHWPKLFGQFADYQFALLQKDGQIAAIGNTVPIYWDGTSEHLPAGWDDGLLRAVQPANQKQQPNTLLVLAGVVDEQQQGKGLSSILLEAFKHTALAQQLQHIVIPVRPTGKPNYPDHSFEQYCDLQREDGLPVDPWLRTHIRAGGNILGIASKSQMVTGSIADWEKWTGVSFEASGLYNTKVTLQPVEIDVEQNQGIYCDPSIWVEHFLPTSGQGAQAKKGLSLIHKEQLIQQLRRRLPAYMVPQTIIFVPSMPLNDNGKIDKNKLNTMQTIETYARDIVLPQNEEEQHILSIWQDVLQLEEISVTDNFFELGGHSLKATAVVARINTTLQCNLSLRELFEQVTIRHLADHIRSARSDANASLAAPVFKKVERRERSRK